MAQVRVEVLPWEQAEPLAAPLRFAAFFDDSRSGIELDAQDPQCMHAIAYDESGKPIGTGRLLPDGVIAPFAVVKEWRRRGVVAPALLEALLAEAAKRGLAGVTVSAPLQAAEFYREQGFIADGKVFKEAGMLQQRMRKPLGA